MDETIFAGNASKWACITAPCFTTMPIHTHEGREPSPEEIERKEAEQRAAKDRALAREEAKQAKREADRKAVKERAALDKALRHERSKKLQADKAMTPEQRRAMKSEAMKRDAATRKARPRAGTSLRPRPTGLTTLRVRGKIPAGYLSIPEVCAKYGRSKTGIFDACNRGDIAFRKEGRYFYLDAESVAKYIASTKSASERIKRGKK